MGETEGAFVGGDGELDEELSAINIEELRRTAGDLERLGASLETPVGHVPFIKLASGDVSAEIFQVTEKTVPNLQRVLLQDDYYYLLIVDGHLKGVIFSEELAAVLAATLGLAVEGPG